MREMKDSGIDWIGNIPKNWDIIKLRFIVKIRNENKKYNQNTPYVGLDNIEGFTGKVILSEDKPDNETKQKSFCKDDVLFCKLRPYLAKCFIAEFDGFCTNELVVIKDFIGIKKYLQYLMLSDGFLKTVVASTYGVKMPRAEWNFIRNMWLALPNNSEQQQIVDYLDAKCAFIDEAINKHKSLIDKIEDHKRSYIISSVTNIYPNRKLKDSNIAWMPKIPNEWEIIPLRFVFGERKHKNVGLIEKNLLTLSYGKIKRKDINTNEGLLPASFEGYNIVEKGDIVMRLLDLQNDWNSLRTGLVTERGIVTSAYVTLYPKRELNSAYFRYLLHSYDLKKVFYTMGEGIRQSLKYDDIGRNLLLPIPSMEEQNEIVNAIKEVETKADIAIARHQQIIEKLEEYRKSIIYNAVTGKIDCRGIPDAKS